MKCREVFTTGAPLKIRQPERVFFIDFMAYRINFLSTFQAEKKLALNSTFGTPKIDFFLQA